MPWEVTGPVKERTRFIETYLTGLYTLTELAERFGVSRQKLHKWLTRHNADGMKGLVDRPRAPLHIPHRTSDGVAETIVAFRRRFPHMRAAQDPSRGSRNCTRISSGRRRARSATSAVTPSRCDNVGSSAVGRSRAASASRRR